MRISLIATALLALAACATPATAPTPSSTVVHLSGTGWRRVDDDQAMPHPATMAFTDARATGYTGCNNWFADVTQDGEVLRFGPIGTTRRACQAEPSQGTERSFLSVLERTRFGHYDRDALVLLDKDQTQIARFERND